MKFSDQFGVTRDERDDWFDTILSVDTLLFLDPFLLYANEQAHFVGSHKQVVAFFNAAFKLIARSGGNPKSLPWKKAEAMLRLPEVEELCLGYTGAGTGGAGAGKGFAKVMAGALWEAVQAGVEEITHFEEVGILQEGIGADRISDATANILRSRLAGYTTEICERHKVPTKVVRYLRGSYDVEEERWVPLEAQLPINPFNNKPILLVPRQYLRELPTINAEDFWEYCFSNENEFIRNEFNYDIGRRVSKKEIVKLARQHPELRRQYLESVEERPPEPYNLTRDPQGLVSWYDKTAEYVAGHPLALLIETEADFIAAVDRMVHSYRSFVEDNRGWNLLWNENGTPRRESAAQDLFLGIVKHYCQANNIDISREPNIGRGPVDFKVSMGYNVRALLELKLARNTKFWDGLTKQLPKYLEAEDVQIGYFIVIMFNDADHERTTGIIEKVQEVKRTTGQDIRHVLVDAGANPPSASKL